MTQPTDVRSKWLKKMMSCMKAMFHDDRITFRRIFTKYVVQLAKFHVRAQDGYRRGDGVLPARASSRLEVLIWPTRQATLEETRV